MARKYNSNGKLNFYEDKKYSQNSICIGSVDSTDFCHPLQPCTYPGEIIGIDRLSTYTKPQWRKKPWLALHILC